MFVEKSIGHGISARRGPSTEVRLAKAVLQIASGPHAKTISHLLRRSSLRPRQCDKRFFASRSISQPGNHE